ncbi:hypothetical protein DPQ33_12985 [Oceanidesulfovibrio indonesiensis]|uniref:Uncharacterized protein n=1 Tax=Oceanidesulfovibrio indonesiensis TaxID=54767 RepID=A0A7M3MCR5_9BACT|nr:hypothetical protein DPQ33_12985 [Oceanidesulfovibrio indonesiensis]
MIAAGTVLALTGNEHDAIHCNGDTAVFGGPTPGGAGHHAGVCEIKGRCYGGARPGFHFPGTANNCQR